MDNILNARIKLKYDTYEHWESIKNSFKPLAGEVILYQIPAQQTSTGLTPPAVGVKVGDGTNFLKDLPWIQAIAGDVYSWAKAQNKPSYNATEISATRTDTISGTTVESSPTVNAWLQALTDDISSLSGGAGSISSQIANALAALDVTNSGSDPHNITGFSPAKTLATLIESDGYISATFQDILIAQSQVNGLTDALATKAPLASPDFTGTPTAPTAAAGTNTTQIATTAFVKNAVDTATQGLTGAMHYKGAIAADPTVTPPADTYESGDVVTNGNKEYVYDGVDWRELGTEGDYAIKGSISNDDIADDAAIDLSKLDIAYIGNYDASTSPLTTKSYVSGLVDDASLGALLTVSDMYKFHPERSDSTTDATIQDGEIKVTVGTTDATTGNTNTLYTYYAKPKNLKTVATSADVYDLLNAQTASSVATGRTAKYFIWDCGDATHLID